AIMGPPTMSAAARLNRDRKLRSMTVRSPSNVACDLATCGGWAARSVAESKRVSARGIDCAADVGWIVQLVAEPTNLRRGVLIRRRPWKIRQSWHVRS